MNQEFMMNVVHTCIKIELEYFPVSVCWVRKLNKC